MRPQHLVMAAAQHSLPIRSHHYRTHRHLTGRLRRARLPYRQPHPHRLSRVLHHLSLSGSKNLASGAERELVLGFEAMSAIGVSAGDVAALIVAVSFAAGLNVYATVLTLGLLARAHWVSLPGGLETLANPWILSASAVLFAGEFIADKIPGIDLVWNALHTFVRVPMAALLAYAASSHLSPALQVLATCAGATLAALAHGSKTVLRAAVTPSPEPVSNIALSTGEDAIAVGLSWAATHHPFAAAGVTAVLAVASITAVVLSVRLLRTAWRRLLRRDPGALQQKPLELPPR